ncbi:MAG: D-alanyl-D-alanine carboxypeptidase/D-alanyl-D-alanine-endopeptidase [Myxococcales bacterium]|nr:D-alanyl-D-alanine carboxypeptidase/D-alanyl-D-alanine-endopeptidase [Myxococcales bacterium]MDD9969771.1 D-alanyl-D-alanine carboxypeptidase/D-alanyl-D-alanine-endopeptidase [Myxococcales bacterium]
MSAIASMGSGAWAQPASDRPPSLVERLRGAIEQASLGDRVGISIVNLRSGREVLAHRAQLPLNPASNMKLLTAAAALLELGPSYRMRTGLYGRQEGDAVVGGLYLRGFGDPTLTGGELVALGQQLVRRGIRRVDEVLVDGTFFDKQKLPPAFEQQPDEVSPFRAAVGAMSVNRNAFELRLVPGRAPGEPAGVLLDAPAYFELDNQVTTSATGAPKIIAIQGDADQKQTLKLRGSIPRGIAGITYRRRVESPAYYTGHIMVEALKALRVQVPRRVGMGPTPRRTALLAEHRSAPLSQVLASLGKNSDNFVAEMVLKLLAAERAGAPGSSPAGVRVALNALRKLDVPASKIKMVNGSGLFHGNQVAASHLTTLLVGMYRRPGLRPDFLAQLAVGGVDGTLERRLKDLPVAGIVRAKTGTLNGVIALSGYVLGPSPERGFAFSFLANGVEGKHQAARALADRLVMALAKSLYVVRP